MAECPVGYGPNLHDNRNCIPCTVEDCTACYFTVEDCDEICTECGRDKYLWVDLFATPASACMVEDECLSTPGFSPLRAVQPDNSVHRTCAECDGYFDHSDPTEPECRFCEYNTCAICGWSFVESSYECYQCHDSAVFDPATGDCRGGCGPVLSKTALSWHW